MKLKYLSLLFSILGIFVLYFLSILAKPSIISLENISKYEGKQITTFGIVSKHHATTLGSQLITIKEKNSTAVIYLEENLLVEYGDKIKVTGEIQKYKDEWEIIVNDKRSISIVEKWNNISFPLWQLSENPGFYIGLNVNVTGYIESINDDFFYLVDLEEKYSLIVYFDDIEKSNFYPGKKLTVEGIFSFDKNNFIYKLDFSNINHNVSFFEEG